MAIKKNSITIPRKVLLRSLDLAKRFVSKNSTLPILRGVYIKITNGVMNVRATNMDIFFNHSVQIAGPKGFDQSVVVPYAILHSILKKTTTPTITLIFESVDNLIVEGGERETYAIGGWSTQEFVSFDNSSELVVKGRMNGVGLLKGLLYSSFPVTTKNFSPVLTGVLLRYNYKAKELTFAGTDSFSLMDYVWSGVTPARKNLEMIVYKEAVDAFIDCLRGGITSDAQKIVFETTTNSVYLTIESEGEQMVVMGRLIQGKYPDYKNENVMPTVATTTIICDAKELRIALAKLITLSAHTNNVIQLDLLGDKKIQLKAVKGQAFGKSVEGTQRVVADVGGAIWADGQLAFNGQYVMNFLKHVAKDDRNVIFSITDNLNKPIILRSNQCREATFVIRPLVG